MTHDDHHTSPRPREVMATVSRSCRGLALVSVLALGIALEGCALFPLAALGGAALNAGYAEVRRLGLADVYGEDNVIVAVFDADGSVQPDFLDAVAPYFADPRTAGVQTAVRMYNAHRNLLTFWQNLEFVVWGELFSCAKDRLGSATLGGNGQFVRLAALRSLGDEPWRASLTEDLDLSMRLVLQGQRIRFCPATAVWQEAVPSLRPLVRQRSRWLQGHLVCWEYLPRVLRASLPLTTRLDAPGAIDTP